MTTVELHPAFTWTCEECGRDHFVRAIKVDPAQLGPDDRATLDAIRDSEGFGGNFLMAPNHVTCPNCKVEFATEEP